MEPIFGFIPAAARSAAAAPTVKEQPEVPQPGDEARERPLRPVMDEYIPEEKQDPAGRYWLGKDGDGQPRIFFDDPERTEDAESCTANTDKVDREIEELKQKKAELEQRLHSETDDAGIRELEKDLAQVERELRQKDNDAYRHRHAVFS